MTSGPAWNPCCKLAINPAQRTNFAGAVGAESRPNWCTGTSQQTEIYVFVGANQFLTGTVGAAFKTLWRTSGAANTWIPYWRVGQYSFSKKLYLVNKYKEMETKG